MSALRILDIGAVSVPMLLGRESGVLSIVYTNVAAFRYSWRRNVVHTIFT